MGGDSVPDKPVSIRPARARLSALRLVTASMALLLAAGAGLGFVQASRALPWIFASEDPRFVYLGSLLVLIALFTLHLLYTQKEVSAVRSAAGASESGSAALQHRDEDLRTLLELASRLAPE